MLLRSHQQNQSHHAREDEGPVDDRDAHHDDAPLGRPDLDAKYMHERTLELEIERKTLYQEMKRIDVENQNYFREWRRCNRQYLRLQNRIGDMEEALVLDIGNTSQLQQTATLLALETQMANAQLAMMKIQKRLLEIHAALKEIYIEGAKLLGVEEKPTFARQMQWFAKEEKRQQKMWKDLGEQMLERAIGLD